MEKTIKITLRQKNGEMKDYFFDFVPLSKRHEYIKKERALDERKDEDGAPIETTPVEYEEMQAEFVAGLFNDTSVTAKTLLEGLDTTEANIIPEIVRYRVLGFSQEEDEAAKKAIQDNLLAGQNSTI